MTDSSECSRCYVDFMKNDNKSAITKLSYSQTVMLTNIPFAKLSVRQTFRFVRLPNFPLTYQTVLYRTSCYQVIRHSFDHHEAGVFAGDQGVESSPPLPSPRGSSAPLRSGGCRQRATESSDLPSSAVVPSHRLRDAVRCRLPEDVAVSDVSSLCDVSFSDASFSDVSFTNASFSDASLSDVSYKDVSLSDVSLSDVGFTDASFSDTSLCDIRLNEVSANGVSFSDVSIVMPACIFVLIS